MSSCNSNVSSKLKRYSILSLEMLQSITVFLLVLTMMKGNWMAELGAGAPSHFSRSLFRSTKFLKAICWRRKGKCLVWFGIMLVLASPVLINAYFNLTFKMVIMVYCIIRDFWNMITSVSGWSHWAGVPCYKKLSFTIDTQTNLQNEILELLRFGFYSFNSLCLVQLQTVGFLNGICWKTEPSTLRKVKTLRMVLLTWNCISSHGSF